MISLSRLLMAMAIALAGGAVVGTPPATGQDMPSSTKWEFKAVPFSSDEKESTEKLNQLSADGWTYVGPLGNGLVAFKRPALLPLNKKPHPLLEGVQEIAAPGQPGSLTVFGPQANALVAGGEKANEVVVAYASWESGRVVAYGHDWYLLNLDTLATADTSRLFLNAIAWAASTNKRKPRVGVWDNDGLVKWLEAKGVGVLPLAGPEWWQELKRIDVLVTHTSAFTAPVARAAVRTFVTSGGGLITADTGWGWAQLNPAKSLVSDHPGNLLLSPAGLLWTGGYSMRTSPQGFKVDGTLSTYLNAGAALEALLQQERGELRLTREEQQQCVVSISLALSVLPPEDPVLLEKLRSIRKTIVRSVVSSPRTPVRVADGLLCVWVALDVHEMKTKPAKEVKAHPAAAIFPGEVPKAAKAVDRELTIDTRNPGWHSTGLYAPPGDLVVVKLLPKAVNKGLSLRIGCHSDALWEHKEWRRMPEVCRVWPLHQATTESANGMGGLVYIDVPEGCHLGEIELGIAGAVEAPLFVLGKTKPNDWMSITSKLPGPWAELATKKIILTVPSSVVRDLRDPDELMKKWDQVLDACADLARIPRDRTRPERFVLDEQISAGYMHSGYPIMAHLDVKETIVSSSMISKGENTWGFFHEIGHNHQAPEWTFDGTVEVTVNLFTMYAHEKVCQRADMGLQQHRLQSEADRNQKTKGYFARGAKFADWKNDPFLALCMYIQLQQAFGWEAFQDVFAEYRQLPPNERPSTEEEKRDQWMVRFSKRVNKNLGPFFETWGVPTSAAARAQIAGLPKWMPNNFPPK